MIRHSQRNLTTTDRYAVGALATTTAKVFPEAGYLDLGAKNSFTKLIGEKRGTASTNETLVLQQTDDISGTPTWVNCVNLAATGLVSSPSSGASMVLGAIPTARYVRGLYTNGDTAQTALVLKLTASEAG